MRFPTSTAGPTGIPSSVFLNLPQGRCREFFQPCHWSLPSYGGPVGLLAPIGPAGDGRPYLGVTSLGTATDLTVDLHLTTNTVVVGPNGGFDVTFEFSVSLNGSVIYHEDRTFHATGWVIGVVTGFGFVASGFAMSPGDVLSAGIVCSRPANGTIPAGAGQADRFLVSGLVDGDEAEEPTWAMRGSGGVRPVA